ncbi:MAG: stage II sporulation protein R [Wujia sp.]
MWKKIARGSLIGIFLGTVLGFAIVVGIYIKTMTEIRIDTINRINSQLIEGYDGGLATNDGEMDYVETAGATDAFSQTSAEISDIAFRFHVKGNSNSEEDLNLKYDVRNAVLASISQGLSLCQSMEEAEQYVADNMDQIQNTALNVVREKGYDYNVRAYLAYDTFPMRQYGELVIPAGTYRALRIDIGEAQGENFWCLLYPTMCYTIEEGAVVSRSDGEIFSRELTYDEYKKLFIKHDTDDNEVKVKFKFLEWLPF